MYPIGKAGVPWGSTEKIQWRNKQIIQRSYQDDVLNRFKEIPDSLAAIQYGALPYDAARYPLFALVPKAPVSGAPWVLITGGVHGYETSGVQGALCFAKEHSEQYHSKVNLVIVPCVSPWGYETINRWNPLAIDPNRSFYSNSPAPEVAELMGFITSLGQSFLMHIDLHETTDTDNSEFRPALAARDAIEQKVWNIPEGFYLVADTHAPQLAFQQAIINAVKAVTPIAEQDQNGKIIGEEMVAEGVICYNKSSLFLCGGFTGAEYCSTTEVYPDSQTATPEICNRAQVAAIEGGLGYLLDRNREQAE